MQGDQGLCGVFMLCNADFLELDKHPNLEQKDISGLRKQTALFLGRNGLAEHPSRVRGGSTDAVNSLRLGATRSPPFEVSRLHIHALRVEFANEKSALETIHLAHTERIVFVISFRFIQATTGSLSGLDATETLRWKCAVTLEGWILQSDD